MKRPYRRKNFYTYAGMSAFLTGLFFVVRVAFADTINIGAPSFVSASDPASFVSGLYTYALSIAGALAVIMIVYGGVKYVASGGSVSARSDAMDIIKNAIFGIVLLFGAYIILYTINPNLVNIKNPNLPSAPALSSVGSSSPSPGGQSTGDCSIGDSPSTADYHVVTFTGSNEEMGAVYTWSFADGSPSDTGQQVTHKFPTDGTFTISLKTSATNQTTGQVFAHSCTMQEVIGSSGGSSSCQVPSSGACSPFGLQSYGGSCFGGAINTAAGVCQVESSGNVTVPSGVDICDDKNKNPASYGLFQINLTANELTDANGNVLNCPSAFADGPYTGKHPHCRVINQSLYNQCVQAAETGSINVAKACALSKNGTDWSQWGNQTRQSCNVN